MENYFKPVHRPHDCDEAKQRQHHHHNSSRSNRYMVFDDIHESPRQSAHDGLHHNVRPCHPSHVHYKEEEILYRRETPVTLSRASSSSLSSSSTSSSPPSSFSSWYTDAAANNPYSLHHVVQPQHSLSCSNIADVRRGFTEDSSSEPVVFATIKQGKNISVFGQSHGPQKRGKSFSSLDRGHSRSEEGLQQDNECKHGGRQSREPRVTGGPLYKTTSLNRSLTFSTEDILLGVSRGPKRAVSSNQLPSKGILKNKEPHTDIRKAKSMEVLSPRLSKGQEPSGQKGRGITQAEIEQARANFVQGKLQFSAFLDEITKQVMSPSDLSILGVNNNKAAAKTAAPAQPSGPVKPQLPPKNYRRSSGEEREQNPKQHSRQEKSALSSSRKHSNCSNPGKLLSYTAKVHQGSPPPHPYPHHPRHNTHHSRKDRRVSPSRSSLSGDRYARSGPHVTDGTSTSPEPIQPKPRHPRKQPAAPYTQQPQPFPLPQPQQAPAAGAGHGSESSSTKSDSSRTRDTSSTATSHSLELGCDHHSQSMGHCKQCRATLCDDHFRALQEENADLHQNLLQTVVCIESLEEELQRTRDELRRVKEKYKSLLETHTGTKQANNLLGEHLHIASESLSSERKYLLTRVSQLSSELEDAHKTIEALENINVPCVIKELLQKHLNSSEAKQKTVTSPVPAGRSAATPADSLPQALKVEDPAQKWLVGPEAGPPRVTAFTPFKQGVPQSRNDHILGQRESNHSPPFTLEDLSADIYRKISARYAARPQPLYAQSLTSNYADTPPNLQQAHAGDDSWAGKGGLQVTLLEEDVVDVTSTSAQKILEEFMRQLQPHQAVPEGEEEKSRQEKMAAEEHMDKGAD